MKTLNKKIEEFNFKEREKRGKHYVKNKCGRDFLYFGLDFYKPNTYQTLSSIGKEIGISVPSFLAWSLLQFSSIGKFLKKNNLELDINNYKIKNFTDFFSAISYSKIDLDSAILMVEESIQNNIVAGIDISIGLGGLLDHVIFVYGFDEENFYVFDTHFIEGFGYEKTKENSFIMKLPKKVIKDRWTRFARVWILKTI